MAKAKHHVFSARTTEEGLRLLNGIREERKVGWDDLVIDAVCAHYGLDRLVMALPKVYRPEKPEKAAGKKAKAEKPAKKAAKETAEAQPT